MDERFTFSVLRLDEVDEVQFNKPMNKAVFTTIPWIRYIAEDSNAIPYIIEISDREGLIGYFTGLKFSKFGVKMFASPFEGWSTCYMGIDLIREVKKEDILKPLCEYIYKELDCVYIEITDRDINIESAEKNGYIFNTIETLELPISMTDESLFKLFKTDCRNFIRQFERRGATIEVANPDDNFAEEYYVQLKDVFAKQGLVPTYSIDKVKCLLRNMSKTDNVLCLRVRDPEGNSIATSIFFGFNEKFFFWGGASYRSGQHYRPNEYMIWTAIKYWRDRGVTTFDMVGVRDYKRKFGSHEEAYAKVIFTKYKILISLRNMAKKAFFVLLRFRGMLSIKEREGTK